MFKNSLKGKLRKYRGIDGTYVLKVSKNVRGLDVGVTEITQHA